MARVPLRETVSVKLGTANPGFGVATVGPISAREVWYPENVHVSVTTPPAIINEAQCAIYVGLDRTQSYFRDACIDGSTGDSSDKVNRDVVRCGEKIFAVWTGGDAAAIAVLTVTGTKEV
jgi:carotenoid cleavage dioxygenase-like enzyme